MICPNCGTLNEPGRKFCREALRAWQGLGLAWDEALCAIDMATILDPADPEVLAAVERARATLTRLGATPMLERLDSAASRSRDGGERLAGAAEVSRDRTPV